MDFTSGQVLAETNADQRLEPASLTKLMSAYAMFHALKDGRIKLDDEVRISAHARDQDGSRMFVDVGTLVSVENLIQGLIVQSGNDATVALAEHVAGSEPVFVDLMNQYAQRLGLASTHFQNSPGMPSPEHYTTARDIAVLSAALIREYPEYYKWYSQRAVHLEQDHAAESQRPARARSDGRRTEDRPHRIGRLLPGLVREARRHAAGVGRDGLAEHLARAKTRARRC